MFALTRVPPNNPESACGATSFPGYHFSKVSYYQPEKEKRGKRTSKTHVFYIADFRHKMQYTLSDTSTKWHSFKTSSYQYTKEVNAFFLPWHPGFSAFIYKDIKHL